MSISRSDGYRRAQGKEGPGLDSLQGFMLDVVGSPLSRIEDADQNYERGDFVAPSGATIECKRQPIDPGRYKQNFVEVCEVTSNPRHRGGYAELAAILDIDSRPRVDLSWSPSRSHAEYSLSSESSLSVSIHTFVHTALVGYVNPEQHIYVYRSGDLLGEIRHAVARRPMTRGAGNSNADTIAVFVPLADWRWSKRGSTWGFVGRGSEARAVRGIRSALEMA